jgi:hypothetical protein
MKLTDEEVAKLVRDDVVTGFVVRVTAGGAKVFALSDLSPSFPPVNNRVLGCRHADRDGVCLFGRASFLCPGRVYQRRRAQPGSSLAVGHRRSRRAAGLTQASTAAA